MLPLSLTSTTEKTTLVDALLRQSHNFRESQTQQDTLLDSNPLERERGITILAKNVAINYTDPSTGTITRINLIDTPGHADFGGEVERVLSMADGVFLLVDAAEGPMPQTRFVLKKAFQHELRPIVVINKIDRPDARAHEVLDMVFDLFVELGADDETLDFPVLYASGRAGTASWSLEKKGTDIIPVFEALLKHVPRPHGDPEKPLADADHQHPIQRLRRPNRCGSNLQRQDQDRPAGGCRQARRFDRQDQGSAGAGV